MQKQIAWLCKKSLKTEHFKSSSQGNQTTCTLKVEIFAGINFCEFFLGHFAGIDFCELDFTKDFARINFRKSGLTKDFAGINFRERDLYKDLKGMNFAFVLRNIFSTTLVYSIENDLSKDYHFLLKQMTK